MEGGVDVERTNYNRNTLLHRALIAYAGEESVELIKYLIDEGVDVNKKNREGITPLHLAVIRFPLGRGSFPRVNENEMEACKDNIEMIELLLSRGATASAVNEKNQTPADYLYRNNFEKTEITESLHKVVRLLMKAMFLEDQKSFLASKPEYLEQKELNLYFHELEAEAAVCRFVENESGCTPEGSRLIANQCVESNDSLQYLGYRKLFSFFLEKGSSN